VLANGSDITPSVTGTPDVVSVALPTTVTEQNADQLRFVFEIWDQPDRRYSLRNPEVAAANRTRLELTGRGLLHLAEVAAPAPPTPTNRAPTAANDQTTTSAGQAVTIAVLANDTDADADPLRLVAVGSARNGLAELVGDQVRYTPAAGFSGSDSFSYIISDGKASATATVSVTVTAPPPPPPSEPPTAALLAVNDDSASTLMNTAVDVAVLANDVAPTGVTLMLSSVTKPAHGQALVSGNQVRYTPANGFVGADSFTYTVKASDGQVARALVSVTVESPPPPPPVQLAVNDDEASTFATAAVDVAVLANDVAPTGVTLMLSSVTKPAHGQAVVSGNKVRYTPAQGFLGPDSFTYTVKASNGQMGTATVTVTVLPKT
jgi:hypothetical protein